MQRIMFKIWQYYLIVVTAIFISAPVLCQEIINPGFEIWEGDIDTIQPVGWNTTPDYNEDDRSVDRTENACTGEFSVNIRSGGSGEFQGPDIGGVQQFIPLDSPISSATITFTYAVDSLPESAYGLIGFGGNEVIDGEVSESWQTADLLIEEHPGPGCHQGSLTVETDHYFHQLSFGLNAFPISPTINIQGFSVFRLDEVQLSTITSIKDRVQSDIDLELYPNPVSDQLTIKTEEKIEQLELMEINGKLINSLDPTQRKMDTSSLPSGIYILRIARQKGSFTRKILKN